MALTYVHGDNREYHDAKDCHQEVEEASPIDLIYCHRVVHVEGPRFGGDKGRLLTLSCIFHYLFGGLLTHLDYLLC